MRIALVLFGGAVTAACAPQLSPRQVVTWDAYKDCQALGPSARLERLETDGGWNLGGREGEIYRVDACMLEQWHRAAREGRVPGLPASHGVTPVKAEDQAPASQSHVRAASITDSSTSSSSR